ncbi:MAG: NADH-quinone oxidoreductase subunit A [Candidatus Micrarchaeales archaeon]|jgi:NADH:ubiquinone oxidoreductase subunit 3 (subunit A)
MAFSYVQVTVFALVSVLVPLSLLLFSKLVRPRGKGNSVQRLPYESAEETIGENVEIMHEYLHYFSLFLAFEMVAAIIIIWSTFSREAQASSGIFLVLLLLFGIGFELLLLGIARSKVD